jgi:aerobic carbon-monoxide dehydrogenase medium subunit
MLSQFKLVQPTTVQEASTALTDLGEKARVYAGGAELLLLLRQRLLSAEVLIDIKKVGELHCLSADATGLSVGACMTHQSLANDPAVCARAPSFAAAESRLANARVRGQGTLGGNLCFNDPHSDPGTVLLVHNAAVKLTNYKGERELPLADFFHDMYATALRPNEILSQVQIPPLPDGMTGAYLRLHRYQRPTLGVAAGVTMAGGSIAECRLAVGCAGPRPLRLHELECQLNGAAMPDALKLVADQGAFLRSLLQPVDDLLGSAEYKLYMTGVMLGQALQTAAQGNSHDNHRA